MSHSERGVALILTLAVLVLATILAVGFAASMRTERQASVSMASNQNAEFIARAALDHATALLSKNIPQPLPPGQAPIANNWSVAPGMLFIGNASIPLSSGDSTSSADPDLNQVDAAGNAQIGAGIPIKTAWLNVLADPSQPANGSTMLPNGAKNQIVGRYAFWIDDENSKININTALGRPDTQGLYFSNVSGAGLNSYIYGMPSYNIPLGTNPRFPDSTNPYSVGLPSSVGIDILGAPLSSNLSSLWNDRLTHQLSSAGDITKYSSAAFFQQNKFWLTHVNGDPEFNAFGKARIFFTDSTFQPNSSEAGPHLLYPGSDGFTFVPEPSQTSGGIRDLAEPLTFHVDANDVNVAGLQDTPTQNSAVAAVHQIASYLNMRWPGYNHSFVEKWSTNRINADTQGKREAQQVAWNLWGMAANAASGSAAMSGTPPTNAMMSGIWANKIRTVGLTTPIWSAYLWNGPQLDATWPASRILPEVRAARIPRFAISFIATQRNRGNTGTVGGLGTTGYVVNVRLWPQSSLPRGLQGLEQLTEAWNPGTQNEEIYITHLEATISDGIVSRPVIWSSEASSSPGSSCLYWDSGGRPNLYHFPGRSIALTPDSLNHDFRSSSSAWDFSTVDNTVGTTPARSISFTFTGGAAHPTCSISNVRLRFVVSAGVGTNAAPTQISPMRDIDGAVGYEAAVTPTDSGAITFPSFSIPTTNLASTTEYWTAMETLDPRVNARGTPTTGTTTSDDWQAWTTALPPAAASTARPADGTRNTRFVFSGDASNPSAYPQIGTSGDESKCAWIDTSNYGQKNPGNPQQQRRMWGSMPGMVNNRMPSVGMISCISTGIQTGIPWRTIKLQPTAEDPPDWLLLDLFSIPWNSINIINTSPDTSLILFTLMNSTQGKININAAAFPNSTTPRTDLRSASIKALFLNAYRPNVVAATSTLVNAATATTLYNSIATYLSNKAGRHFDYAGELCQVAGISDATSGSSEWEREALIRQLGSLITTRSNVFSVWGVAQTVKKHPFNNNPANLGIYETRSGGAVADDLITGEKRFHAIIQRHVWPGIDGTIGNGQAASGAAYTQLGSTANLGSPTNTIDGIDPTAPDFYQKYNPGAAVMKYRVIYFEYLN